jgi:hypothetical protein
VTVEKGLTWDANVGKPDLACAERMDGMALRVITYFVCMMKEEGVDILINHPRRPVLKGLMKE